MEESSTYRMAGGYAALLRQEIAARNRAWAVAEKLPHAESSGGVVAYLPYTRPDGVAAHGNFYPAAYRALGQRPDWARRLRKVHTSGRSALPRTDRPDGSTHQWCELDSCMSSDALLMSIFCTPAVTRSARVAALLGLHAGEQPAFGVPGQAVLRNGGTDRTELDMRLGDLLVEAKLTELDFQARTPALLEQYRDFETVFDPAMLPLTPDGRVRGYQLIRNILAAYARGARFCLLADARRPDLLEQYAEVQRGVMLYQVRTRCMALTWQELASACPAGLRTWLRARYGIE